MTNLNHIITLQRMGNDKQWTDVGMFHAGVNKASGKEFLQAGGLQSQLKLIFTLRYCKATAQMQLNTQRFRILYNGGTYKVADYDDFMERHRFVKVLGVSYGTAG